MKDLFDRTCRECAMLITQRYSTSFSMGIRAFGKSLRPPIYAIYGYVRFADEIVDTFDQHDQASLLERFRRETFLAIEEGISLNPVLHAFQEVVNRYKMDHGLIEAFLDSMAMDLGTDAHTKIKGNNVAYYTDAMNEARTKSLAEFKKRDDAWLLGGESKEWNMNNYCKWFHVVEHFANHRGQITWYSKRLPGKGD